MNYSLLRKIKNPGLMVLSMFLAIGMLEIGIRLLRPDLLRRNLEEFWQGHLREFSLFSADTKLHHVIPNKRELRVLSNENKIPQILIVGDSFADGDSATWGQSFAYIVQQNLKNKAAVSLGAGSSYSPIIYRNIINGALSQKKYDIVSVFIDQTDPSDDVQYEPDLIPGTHDFDLARLEARNSTIFKGLNEIVLDLKNQSLMKSSALVNLFMPISILTYVQKNTPAYEYVQLLLKKKAAVERFNIEPENPEVKKMESVIFRYVDEIYETCLKANAFLILEANPWEFQVSRNGSSGGLNTTIKEMPAKNRLEELLIKRYMEKPNIEIVPMTKEFRSFDNPNELFNHIPDNDIHWNNKGHHLAGSILTQFLLQRLKQKTN